MAKKWKDGLNCTQRFLLMLVNCFPPRPCRLKCFQRWGWWTESVLFDCLQLLLRCSGSHKTMSLLHIKQLWMVPSFEISCTVHVFIHDLWFRSPMLMKTTTICFLHVARLELISFCLSQSAPLTALLFMCGYLENGFNSVGVFLAGKKSACV